MQSLDELHNRGRFGLQQAFHNQLATSIHHGNGDGGLMNVHADILFLTHKGAPDLLPAFRTSPSMISDEGKGKGYVEEQAHGSGDDWSAETTGGGAESGGCGAGSGSIEAHDLCLEGEVRRHGCKPGAGSQAVAG